MALPTRHVGVEAGSGAAGKRTIETFVKQLRQFGNPANLPEQGGLMLYPRANRFRQLIELSGFWDFRPDPRDEGTGAGWVSGFDGGVPLAVPASWNDQATDLRDFLGPAWYSTAFEPPECWDKGQLLLRFDSVNYLASVWLNGVHLGDHEGGHLPFSFDVTSTVRQGENLLV
ncbi:MAG TPA: hypothetical protein VL354_09375, partial [Spirochaetia bacterium]|nr:hypothetical protein [Spirochaetia bacterium]